MKKKNIILNEAGVLFIATMLVLTSIITVTSATKVDSPAVVLDEKVNSVTKMDSFNVIWSEDFSAGYYYTPPPGWDIGGSQTFAWRWYPGVNYIILPGVASPNTRLDWYYAIGAELISPKINTLGVGTYLGFEMAMYYVHYASEINLTVEIRPLPTASWIDITPWINPVTSDMGPDWYISVASLGIGAETQLRFSIRGFYYNMNYWYFDNLVLKDCVGDTTPPVTTHMFNPGTPNGNAGWYKDPGPTVTLDASDTSGIAKTRYSLNGGLNWIDYTGPIWPFSFPVSGCINPGDFMYYSEDPCGNVESIVTVPTFKVDTIQPTLSFIPIKIPLPLPPFICTFICIGTSDDSCSGIDRVDIFRDTIHQEKTVTSPGLFFCIRLRTCSSVFTAIAYDVAGNHNP